jgi:DNA-binding CsgD family transcriptional regulator
MQEALNEVRRAAANRTLALIELTQQLSQMQSEFAVLRTRIMRELGVISAEQKLTTREMQVAQFIIEDYSNKEIANLLGITESTVKFHCSLVLKKLDVKTRYELKKKRVLMTVLQNS